jgi:CelD/BcsL family acetyltransferase involved in cellulose biosynthesis
VRWSTIKIGYLTPQQIETWHKLHHREAALKSPFTTYEFCHAVDKIRGNVFATILENSGNIKAILPFERPFSLIPGIARKPGGHLSDCFGMIGSSRHPLEEHELLKHAGLSVFSFDHLPLQNNTLPLWRGSVSHGVRVEVPNFNDYIAYLRKANKKFVKEVERHSNQLVQQYGEMNFQWQAVKPLFELERLIDRKRSQYVKSGSRDALKSSWSRKLLAELLATQHPNCEAILSTLYCGDTWVASNLSLRNEQLLHIWFPVFNRALRRFGPGHVLFLKLFESATKQGVTVIDFGGGLSAYKMKYAGTEYPLFKGSFQRINPLSLAYRVAQSLSWRIRPLFSK